MHISCGRVANPMPSINGPLVNRQLRVVRIAIIPVFSMYNVCATGNFSVKCLRTKMTSLLYVMYVHVTVSD